MDIIDENDEDVNKDSGDWLQPTNSKRGKLKALIILILVTVGTCMVLDFLRIR